MAHGCVARREHIYNYSFLLVSYAISLLRSGHYSSVPQRVSESFGIRKVHAKAVYRSSFFTSLFGSGEKCLLSRRGVATSVCFAPII